MSQANVEIVRRTVAAFESTGDLEGFLESCAEDIVWDVSRSDFPDKGIYHGLDGVREWMRTLEDAFEGLVFEFEEITDLGQNRVLLVARMKRSEEHTSELQSRSDLVCRLLLEKKKKKQEPLSRSGKRTAQLQSRKHYRTRLLIQQQRKQTPPIHAVATHRHARGRLRRLVRRP